MPGIPGKTSGTNLNPIHWFNQRPGPCVIFLHGFTGSVSAWQDGVDCLGQDLAMGALYLPGHHPSAPPQASFAATCDVLARALVEAKLGPVVLVGYSLGARLALALTLRHPRLVASLVLIGGHFGLEQEELRQQREQDDRAWQQLLLQQGIAAFVERWEQQPIFCSQRTHAPQKFKRQRRLRLSHNPLDLAASLASCGLAMMPNYWPDLATVSAPVLLIAGENDQKYVALAHRANALFRRSRVALLAACGHNPLLEQPTSMARVLSQFLMRPTRADEP